MSLNKFTNFQTGLDLNFEIGAHTLECDDLIVLNSITLPPNVSVDNLTVNDSLTVVCDDTSTYNLTTATNGNLGDILSTDGNGNTYWSAVPTPPLSGITYSGTLPAQVGRILQISNPTATTCDRSSILENLTEITVEKAIQLTANKITSSYVPINPDDLTNKLYVDSLNIPVSINSAGSGTSLISSNTNPNFDLKSLIGSGINLTNTSTEITLTNSLPSTLISLTTGGTVVGTNSLVATSSGNPALKTKGIAAGSNISITDSGNDLTINSSGGSYTFTNGGTGTTLIATTSTLTDFKPVSLTAGTNVTIAGSGTDNLTISSAGASGTNTVNITSITTSASTYYPVFNANTTGVTSTLSTDSGGLSYIPTSNLLTTGAMNSGIYTSTVVPPAIGFVGHASSCNKIQTTDGSAFSSTYYPTFVPLSTSSTSQDVSTDSGLNYIPNQNKLTTSLFNGSVFTSTTAIPGIGFVGASTSSSKVQTTDGSAFTSPYFITFVPLSSSQDQQSVSTDTSLPYTPNTNTLGLVSTTKYTGNTFTSNNTALVAGFVGTSSNTLEISQTDVSASASIFYPMLSTSSNVSTTLDPSGTVNVDNGLSYQPSTNTLTTSIFSGNLTGNSSTATNISAVATNQLLYQSATNTTSVLAQGTLGQFLKSNGALAPTWENSRGFTQNFGGKSILIGDYLTPSKWADTASTSVIASSYLTQWRCPIACSITGWSSSVQTTGVAQLSILVNTVAGSAIVGVASATSQSATITARAVNANDLIEVRIINAICNACCITLYFS